MALNRRIDSLRTAASIWVAGIGNRMSPPRSCLGRRPQGAAQTALHAAREVGEIVPCGAKSPVGHVPSAIRPLLCRLTGRVRMPRSTDARERMIVSAALLQRERGVPGTGLPDVLKHSGAPRGSVYHHFPGGRAQVAEEATAFAAEQLSRGLDALLADLGPVDALDAFAALWRDVLSGEQYAAGCPVAAGALDHTPHSGARRAAAAGFDRWNRAIAHGLTDAGVTAERADLLATTAISAFEGAIILSRAKQSTAPIDAVATILRDVLTRELSGA
jgi:AcrR family transcriptional regulator